MAEMTDILDDMLKRSFLGTAAMNKKPDDELTMDKINDLVKMIAPLQKEVAVIVNKTMTENMNKCLDIIKIKSEHHLFGMVVFVDEKALDSELLMLDERMKNMYLEHPDYFWWLVETKRKNDKWNEREDDHGLL